MTYFIIEVKYYTEQICERLSLCLQVSNRRRIGTAANFAAQKSYGLIFLQYLDFTATSQQLHIEPPCVTNSSMRP